MFLRVELMMLATATVIMITKGQNCPIQCEQITAASCQQGLSYTSTGFPNYFGHADTNDSIFSTLSSGIPFVVQSSCYAGAQAFLCGLLVPQCVQGSGLVFPSRTMCEAFASGCSLALVQFSIQLDCSESVFMDNPVAQCNTVPTLPALPTTRNSVPTLPALPNTPGPSTMTNSAGNMTDTTPACGIQCEPITIAQCPSQSYSETGFPNIFQHTSQAEVEEFALYITLGVATGCYANTEEFLCGLLLPECRVNEGLVYPNKQMCENFLAGCGPTLAALPDAAGLDIDCTLFVETPEPVCYAQPPVLTTEKPAMIPTTNSRSGQGSGSGQTECPKDQTCSAFSINCGQNTMILLILVFLMKVM